MASQPKRLSPSRKKKSQNKNQKCSQEQSDRKGDLPQFTPLNIPYDRLLPIIRDHSDFKWPLPMRLDPQQQNQSLRCNYHRDHGHETNRCRGLKFLVEKLIRVGHLRRYIREPVRGAETAPAVERVIAGVELPSEPRPAINYILGGPTDDQYQSKRQRRKMLRAATVRARVNTIKTPDSGTAIQPIDGPISFPPINPFRIITPHYDVLMLTLCINEFDVQRVLVDPGSTADLLHLPAFRQMKVPLYKLRSAGRILSEFNGATTLTVGDIAIPVNARPVTQQVLFSVVEDFRPYNAIVGRPWIHSMKAVPSTYHQTISYLTNAEQVGLQSSQLAAT